MTFDKIIINYLQTVKKPVNLTEKRNTSMIWQFVLSVPFGVLSFVFLFGSFFDEKDNGEDVLVAVVLMGLSVFGLFLATGIASLIGNSLPIHWIRLKIAQLTRIPNSEIAQLTNLPNSDSGGEIL